MLAELTRIKWNLPLFHFCTASSPFFATSYLILFFFINVDKMVWLMGLSGNEMSKMMNEAQETHHRPRAH